MQTIIATIMPMLMEIIGIVLTALLAWAAAKAREKWDVEIQEKHLRAMHSALMTGARVAAAGNLSTEAAIRIILDHVRGSVPDALRALEPSGGTLRNLAAAKLAEVRADLEGKVQGQISEAMAKLVAPVGR